MPSVLSADRFHNEEAAFAWVESRLWPTGPTCPRCGATSEHVGRLQGKTTRPGLYKCYACRKPFTVRIGTLFESSHAPLRYWLQAIHLLCSSKKGISTRQLQRTLGVGMKTAWFLGHRIREAMRENNTAPMGGSGGPVEIDETYIWQKAPENRRTTTTTGKPFTKSGKSGPSNKRAIISLVERGGSSRSFHVENADKATVNAIVAANVAREARVHTDESRIYGDVADHVAMHESVKHSAGEYARGDVTTNSVEGYFSVFKRGMHGTYQHCSEKHLHRYLAEFDFRFSNRSAVGIEDVERADLAIKGVKGKRLTYQTTRQ